MRRLVLASIAVGVFGAAACSSDGDDVAPGNGGTSGGPAQDGGFGPDGSSSSKDGSTGNDGPPTTDSGDAKPNGDAATGTITVTSPAFAGGASIPKVHSCNGTGESIPLQWSGAPNGTQSYAVVMRDLSLPGANKYHWVIWDISGTTTSLPQGIAKQAQPPVPAGAKQTAWSFGAQVGYGHMCPPSGTHEYELSVYALPVATLPSADPSMSPNEVDAAIQANKTAAGSIVGKYTHE